MKSLKFKDFIPHIAAILIFVIISIAYFSPPVLEGKEIRQHDVVTGIASQKEITDFRKETGEEALWTNSMFSGMPAYQISVKYINSSLRYIKDAVELWLPVPSNYIMLYLVGFYILMLVLGISPWLSIAGAIAFAFSSYFFVIIGAGHIWKVRAIAFMAPALAGILLTYKGKYVLGGILTAVFLTLELFSNHIQMTYYFMILVGIFSIGEFIYSFKENELSRFFKSILVIAIASVIAIGVNFTNLAATYQYGKYTIRGKSELSFDSKNKTSGLDRDYVTGWSYGIGESWSFLIPNAKGGASGYLGEDKSALKNVDPAYKENISQSSHYWGNQPGTSGPVYMGAFIVFLFIFGMFILKWRYKWPLFITTLLVIFLSWGKNWMGFTNFFLDYFPLYNKFRSVSSILVIAELTFPLLAFLTLKKIWETPDIIKTKRKEFFIAFGLTGGIALVLFIAPKMFLDFINNAELSQFANYRTQNPGSLEQINSYISNLEAARVSIFKADAIRSFFFILMGAASIFLFSIKKIGKTLFVILISAIVLIDMAFVDKRYMGNDKFMSKRKAEVIVKPTTADKIIMKDTDPDYRVMNLTISTFNDATTSYFHKSIGGYHGAKLRRYQELIEYQISKNNMNVLNMLNTKYFIVKGKNGAPDVQVNMEALGNCWFVDNIKWVDSADDELMSLSDFDPAKTAIINSRFKSYIDNKSIASDSMAQIVLKEYKPNHLTYLSKTSKDNLAVFSEIYYADGWDAYIDGQKADHIQVDYVLRAMIIPAGEHTIEFKFEPKVYYIGEKISAVSMIVLLIVVLGGLYLLFKPVTLKSKED